MLTQQKLYVIIFIQTVFEVYIVELIFEFLITLYVELMLLVVPEEKVASKKFRAFVAVIAIIVLLGLLALFVISIGLIEDKSPWGWLGLIVAIVLSLVQIIAGFAVYDKKNRND